jgi:hypothetical protein
MGAFAQFPVVFSEDGKQLLFLSVVLVFSNLKNAWVKNADALSAKFKINCLMQLVAADMV